MAQTELPQDSNTQNESPTLNVRQRAYLPGRVFWIIVALCIVTVFVLRWANEDRSFSHIGMFASGLICATLLWIWFLFRSAYSMGLRVFISLTLVVLMAYLGYHYKFLRVSGDMIPEFARRQLPADWRMEKLDASGTADLVSASVNDFPQFLGPNRDGVLADCALADWRQNPPVEKWRRPIGAGWSSFAVVNGFAITMEQRGEEEFVTCYRVDDGQPVWSNAVQTRHGSPLGFVGPRSTPTIYEGKVYAFGATAILRCLRGTDGQSLWHRDLYAELGISQKEAEKYVAWGRANSPLIAAGHVIIPLGGGDKPISLMAVDPDTGETVWQAGTYQVSYASPVLATLHGVPQVLSVNQDFVTSHDVQTGEVLWQHNWPGLSYMNANCSQPIAIDDHRVFLSKGYGAGCELISVAYNGGWSTERIWKAKVLKTKFSNVMIRDGFVYGLDDGILSCIELETGIRKWKKGRYGYGQNLMVGDLIVVLAEDGDLALVEANPEKYVELARLPALDGHTWNNPVLAGDMLLMRNSEQATCFQVKLK